MYVDLRQGCVMSSLLFNLYVDRVMKEINARDMSREVELEHNGHDCEMIKLLCANDTVLITDPLENLQRLVNVFGEVHWTRSLEVNGSKTTVIGNLQ